jgi:hypothetical protein
LQRRGRSAGKHVGGRRNAEQAEPVRKGKLEKRVDVAGDEQEENLLVLMSSARRKKLKAVPLTGQIRL